MIAAAILVGCTGSSDNGVTTPPDNGAIGVSLAQATLSLVQGAVGTVNVTVSRTTPFTGTVNLSLENAPTGVTPAFAPSAVATGSTTSTLTLNVAATTATGNYTLTVRAKGTNVDDKTATLTLTVGAAQTPAFTLALSQTTLTVPQGGNGTVTATIARVGGFNGLVAVAVTVAAGATGLTGVPNPVSVTGTSSTITISATATAATGTFNVTVTGTGVGVAQQTATVAVTVTPTVSGSYTLSVAPTQVSLQQGTNTNVTVNINRTGGFAGAVALAVTGGPAGGGLTGTANPASTTGNTSTVTLAATAAAAAGTYTVTVTGTTAGLANQTVTIQVTITTAGGSGNVIVQFCPNTTLIPVWVGFQDGTGAWVHVTLSANNTATFNITSGRGGVAYITQGANGSYTLTIYYATQAELTGGGVGGVACVATPTTKTLTGTVAGLSGTETALIAFRGAIGQANAGQPGFTLNNVSDGIGDLFAGRTTTTISGTSISTTLSKAIIRRGLNPAAGSVLPVLDFGSSEAFDPLTRTLTINGAGTDQLIFSATYATANNTSTGYYTDIFGTGNVRTYYGVPSARQAAGDLHGISLITSGAGNTTGRIFQTFFKDAVDKTVTLGPNLNTTTVTTVGTTPYPRLRTTVATQPEFNRFYNVNYSQGTGAAARMVAITATAAYAGATFDQTIPDLTPAGGIDVNWLLKAAVSTSFNVFGYGWTGGTNPLVQPLAEGAVIQAGLRSGAITP